MLYSVGGSCVILDHLSMYAHKFSVFLCTHAYTWMLGVFSLKPHLIEVSVFMLLPIWFLCSILKGMFQEACMPFSELWVLLWWKVTYCKNFQIYAWPYGLQLPGLFLPTQVGFPFYCICHVGLWLVFLAIVVSISTSSNCPSTNFSVINRDVLTLEFFIYASLIFLKQDIWYVGLATWWAIASADCFVPVPLYLYLF